MRKYSSLAPVTAAQAQTTGWHELVDGSDNLLYAIAGTRLVRVNRDGSGFASIHTNMSGSMPDQLFEGSDGRLYVVEAFAFGLIYRIDPGGSNRTVVRDFGAVKGGWLAFKRVLRCGPWTPMGTDDPPPYS